VSAGNGRAVVIGSGFGGLAAAVRLRAMGYRVTLLEALEDPGGRARVLERDGFTFDLGPSVITAPHMLDELFTMVGRDPRDYFRLAPVDPLYRIRFPGGETLDYVQDEDRLLEEIRRINPADAEGYRELAAHAKRIFRIGFEELADEPFHSFRTMLRILPDMVRLDSLRSVYSVVSRYIEDERLRQAFTFEALLVGGDPFRTSSIYLLVHWLERKWGVHFAMGGTGSVIHALVRLLDEMGVDLHFGTPVEEVLVRDGRAVGVRTAGGRTHPADLVVSNADPSHLYTRMLAPRHRRPGRERAVRRMRQSMSLFVGYFGTDRQYPELAHHTILLGPRYRELLKDIFQRRVLAEDASIYLHAPTRTDPSMAPPGHDTFYVLAPVPNNRSSIDWTAEGPAYMERLLEMLEERLLPGVREHVVTSFYRTPDYFEHTLRSVDGSAFGPEPLLTQSAYFRYHNRSPDVEELYFVGAGTHPGAGIPGVLSSARLLERIVPRPDRPEAVPAPDHSYRSASTGSFPAPRAAG